MRQSRLLSSLVRTLACVPAALLIHPAVVRAQAPAAYAVKDADWPAYNRTLTGERYSPLRAITAANAARLRQKCVYDTHEKIAFQTGPIVVDGTMYFTTDTITYAIDAGTCALKWRQRTGQAATYLAANRGIAYDDGRLFHGAGTSHVLALDAASGRPVWDISLPLPAGTSMPMAPIAWNGMVFVGNAGGDSYGVIGNVYALDQRDGHVVWRFRTVPDSGPIRETWRNPDPSVPVTGGAFWSTFALDPARSTLFVPAGNPAPDYMPELRPGDNLFTNSVIGIDTRNASLTGYVQLVKHDFHDWDVSTPPVLITTRGGRSLVLSANKDGLLSAIDRREVRSAVAKLDSTGRSNPAFSGDLWRTYALLYQTPTTTRENTDIRVHSNAAVRFCPGSQGGSEWNGPTYLPSLNLAVVGAVDWCTSLQLVRPESIQVKPGMPWTGAIAQGFGVQDSTAKWQGWITAVDADSGTVRWKHRTTMPMLAGITSTASGLIITGELTGNVDVFDARNGRLLWQGKTGNAIGGGVITYEAGGRQLIAAAAGMNSATWPVKAATARIVVFGAP